MKNEERIHIFEGHYLPIDEYLESCKASLIKTLNWISKRKAPETVYTELERMNIRIATLRGLVKAVDPKSLLPFIDKKKGFDIASALNRLCEDIVKLRKE